MAERAIASSDGGDRLFEGRRACPKPNRCVQERGYEGTNRVALPDTVAAQLRDDEGEATVQRGDQQSIDRSVVAEGGGEKKARRQRPILQAQQSRNGDRAPAPHRDRIVTGQGRRVKHGRSARGRSRVTVGYCLPPQQRSQGNGFRDKTHSHQMPGALGFNRHERT